MGVASRGAAISRTEERTDRMILIVSIGILVTLAVGGIVMATNSYGDQNRSPIGDLHKTILDGFGPVETAQPQSLREDYFVSESESGCWGPLCTEQGSIKIDYYNIPEVLPLCIDSAYLQEWYVDVLVYGGYNPG